MGASSRFDGAKLKAARKSAGYNLKEYAVRSGVSLAFIKYVEAGTSQPGPLYAAALAAALDLTVDDLTSEVDDSAPVHGEPVDAA